MENVTEYSPPKSLNDNNDNSKNVQTNFASINCIGFKTASAKPIEVSREAHIKAAGILSELPDIPTFEDNSQSKICDSKTVKGNLRIISFKYKKFICNIIFSFVKL